MEKLYRNILVALDGSSNAELALDKGINLAKRNQANLYLVHAVDTGPYRGIEMYDVHFTNRVIKQAKELLNGYKQKAEDAGAEHVHVIVNEGSPKTIIPRKIAPEFHVDLILCGAKGVNALERLFIGSVSENIVRQAKCDVLIVRNTEQTDTFK